MQAQGRIRPTVTTESLRSQRLLVVVRLISITSIKQRAFNLDSIQPLAFL